MFFCSVELSSGQTLDTSSSNVYESRFFLCVYWLFLQRFSQNVWYMFLFRYSAVRSLMECITNTLIGDYLNLALMQLYDMFIIRPFCFELVVEIASFKIGKFISIQFMIFSQISRSCLTNYSSNFEILHVDAS